MAALRRPGKRRGNNDSDATAQPNAPQPSTSTAGSDESVDPSRRSFLKAAGMAAAGAAAGGLGGAAIGAMAGAEGARMDFAPDAKAPQPGFDHLVVLMYENRSFDNLLGWLYDNGDIPAGMKFDGLHQGDYWNPGPGDDAPVHAHAYTGPTDVVMSSPHPDPGEAFPHVNTQLFGTVDPLSNEDLTLNPLEAPYNAPPPGKKPEMKGFVHDYIINYRKITGDRKYPTRDEYSLAMGGFSPEMLPVVSRLAREFAVYDHWHCAVPSQTFCNRSFFHASTSHGYVTNKGFGGYDKWLDEKRADSPTVFNRLEEAGIPWRVYYDEAQLVSMTGVLHAPVLQKYWKTNFRTMEQFYEDVKNGTLPAYAFVEPRMIYNHNDMHPPYGVLRVGKNGEGEEVVDGAVSDVRAGDTLLHFIYSAIKNSDSAEGSNAMNTMLFVTFDEHGGTYDHVPPPEARPPYPGAHPGEMGFRFDRLGCRVPAIAISAFTKKNTIINDPMHHGSVIATLSKQHGLAPLTFRDEDAPDMFNALNATKPRPVSDWPTTTPHYLPANPDVGLNPNDPKHSAKKLSNPAKGLLGLLIAKYGSPQDPMPKSYVEAFDALHNHAQGLFGTTDAQSPPPSA